MSNSQGREVPIGSDILLNSEPELCSHSVRFGQQKINAMFLTLAEITAAFTKSHTTLFSKLRSRVSKRPTGKKDPESCSLSLLKLVGMRVELHCV